MNILWASNYSSQSGYANQARLFVPRLQALGHNVVVFELSNGSRMPSQVGTVKILPTALDPLGSDVFPAHAEKARADAVITLCDAWGFQPEVMKRFPWFPYTPIDHTPVPPAVMSSLKAAVRPIAMSQFGQNEMRKQGIDSFYLPHGVDPAVWYPGDKREARQKLGIPADVFFVSFVGVNDSNPSRKGIPELLTAWSIFSQRKPNSKLYLHTSDTGNLAIAPGGGVRIDMLIKTLGIDPDTIKLVNQYDYRTGIPAAHLADVARASDALILPSRGEGFGLPLLEFQRVGCPVITTAFATQEELCFSGWLVETEPEWSLQNAMQVKPGVASLVDCLAAAYADRDNPQRKVTAVERAKEYDIDVVVSKYAAPILHSIAEILVDNVRVTA